MVDATNQSFRMGAGVILAMDGGQQSSCQTAVSPVTVRRRNLGDGTSGYSFDLATMDRHELQDAVATAYGHLSRKELCLLLSLRSLPMCGDPQELAFRLAVHDLSHRTDLSHPPDPSNRRHPSRYTPPQSVSSPPPDRPNQINNTDNSSSGDHDSDTNPHDAEISTHQPLLQYPPVTDPSPHNPNLPTLPPELWADIFESLNDWELSTSLGIHTKLRRSADWVQNGTRLDYAILSGSVSYVMDFLSLHPTERFTKFGAKAMVRFAFTDLLTFFWERYRLDFLKVYLGPSLKMPTLASHYGQTKVLSWWLSTSLSEPGPANLLKEYDEEPLKDASREGHIHVLQWWKSSGLELKYGPVMDVASSFGHLSVLEWWKNSGLTLNYLHALKGASYRGEVGVLEWWKKSGLRLVYDKEVLVEATKFNRPDVLQWWSSSGLRVEYCLCDIEAALEDAIGGGGGAKAWWLARGCRFDVPVTESMEYKRL